MGPDRDEEPFSVRPDGADPETPAHEPADGWAPTSVTDIGMFVRNGLVVRAGRQASMLDRSFDQSLSSLYSRLRQEGYKVEVGILELIRTQPQVLRLLGRSSLIGLFSGIIAFVAFLYPLWIFALVPAMAVRVVVTELFVWLGASDSLGALEKRERLLARNFFDLGVYATGRRRRVGLIHAGIFVAGGIGSYVTIIVMRSSIEQPFLTLWASGAVLAGVASALVIGATRRLRLSGLRPVPAAPITSPPMLPTTGTGTEESEASRVSNPPRLVWPPTFELARVRTFKRPRLAFAGLLALIFAMTGTMSIASQTPEGYAIGFPCVLVAAVVLGRAAQTKVLIGLDGIVDVGVMRTRRYGWDDIAALRMVPEPGGETESIHLIEAGGRDRLLIPAVAVAATRPDLARVCEAVTALGRAPVPPVPAIRTTRLPPSFAAILLLTSFGCFAALFVFGALLGDTSAAVDGTAIPAGREYYRFPGSDGTLGPPKIVCPSLGQWIGGKRDPMCGSAMRTQAAILGVSVTITTALLASAAWLLIKRRRMRANDSGTDPPHFERTLTT